jgi:cytochrome c-type biogenesis protein CcmE
MDTSSRKRGGVSVGAIIAVIVVVGLGLVIFATASGGQYAVAIDQITSEPERFHHKKVRVVGNIKAGSTQLLTTNGQPELRFAIVDEHGNELKVVYNQAPPDPYKEGRSSVVEGVLQPDGSVLCQKLTVKCPSKYQGEGGDAPTDGDDGLGSPAFDRYRTGAPATRGPGS